VVKPNQQKGRVETGLKEGKGTLGIKWAVNNRLFGYSGGSIVAAGRKRGRR